MSKKNAVHDPNMLPAVVPARSNTASVNRLLSMLTSMRPHNSWAECRFIGQHIMPLGAQPDKFNNYYIRIGDSPVAWSSHTDTVHHDAGTQVVMIDEKNVVKLPPKSAASCLGADDTGGVWLMTEMIRAKVPGLYIFHRGEEVGCQGSRLLVKGQPELVEGIKCMIALDRKGLDSVITRQVSRQCCSDEFGTSLAEKLGLGYKLDPYGMVTDSAQYVELIGECTNVSVGYYSQHCKSESLDLNHIVKLRDALLKFDHEGLVYKRCAGDKDVPRVYNNSGWSGRNRHWENGRWVNDDEDEDFHWDTYRHKNHVPRNFTGGYYANDVWVNCQKPEWEKARKKYVEDHDKRLALKQVVIASTKKVTTVPQVAKPDPLRDVALHDLVKQYPEEVAAIFGDWGFDTAMLVSEIKKYEAVLDKKADDDLQKSFEQQFDGHPYGHG